MGSWEGLGVVGPSVGKADGRFVGRSDGAFDAAWDGRADGRFVMGELLGPGDGVFVEGT